MKLQLKEDDKNVVHSEQSVIIMELNAPKYKQELQTIHLKETMETKQEINEPVQPPRRRRHKHHRSDEYPMYNKDGSRSILAQLLQDEEAKSGKRGQLSTTPMSKSMDNLHLCKHSSVGMPVLKSIDFSKSMSQENIRGPFPNELSKSTKASSRQLGRTGSMSPQHSIAINRRSYIEQEIVARTTDLDISGSDDQRPPPPDYPGHSHITTHQPVGQEIAASSLNADVGCSNSDSKENISGVTGSMHGSLPTKDEIDDSCSESSSDSGEKSWLQLDHQAIAERATQMVEILSDENAALRQEVESYYQKVSKLQKFEQDIEKVQNSYEYLVKSTAKREYLEKMMRSKLELEFKLTQEKNKELEAQVESLKAHLHHQESPLIAENEQLKAELRKRDEIYRHLMNQHTEDRSNKSRVEVELAAQRATLSEQRTHIDVLDTALSNAQANVVRLQEECQRKQVYVDKVEKLQQALVAIQNASDKREQLERKVRLKLEKELDGLKAHQRAVASQEHDEGVSLDSPNNSQTLMELVKERDEKILFLEAEVTKWEQRYLQEVALKQCIDPRLSPRSLSAERNADEGERKFMNEKVKHMEELLAINKRCTELDSHVKSLTKDLNEKQALISVLQHQSLEKDQALASLDRLLRGTASPHGSSQNIAQGSWQHVPQGSSLQNVYQGYQVTMTHESLPSVSQASSQSTSHGSLQNVYLSHGSLQNVSPGSQQKHYIYFEASWQGFRFTGSDDGIQ
uniref:Angiomotin-like n=1 Tax=Saccoglossus kowalevskii TaxID=10224 RepID=A0ABM0H1Q8_SACKO|nr:PREDICTED: angiomotin-like [Saccoglossus kowalevskii]